MGGYDKPRHGQSSHKLVQATYVPGTTNQIPGGSPPASALITPADPRPPRPSSPRRTPPHPGPPPPGPLLPTPPPSRTGRRGRKPWEPIWVGGSPLPVREG